MRGEHLARAAEAPGTGEGEVAQRIADHYTYMLGGSLAPRAKGAEG